ncbi:hypothetical protein C8F04DRAFT_1078194 [Mycena alexandri]|uniref:Uncharacterized protein n=1 Tax=Mycena alexandri TaxID=1745969 RepID=A0AAD6TCX9_9AGAR|nr:hypothetical protein C8F04DRAFT_1078194 [Mycena alexandri]
MFEWAKGRTNAVLFKVGVGGVKFKTGTVILGGGSYEDAVAPRLGIGILTFNAGVAILCGAP